MGSQLKLCVRAENTRKHKIFIKIMSKTKRNGYRWCFTRYEPDQKTTFHWKIDNFNKRMEEASNTSFLQSDTFKIDQERFNLKLVLNSESSGFFISDLCQKRQDKRSFDFLQICDFFLQRKVGCC